MYKWLKYRVAAFLLRTSDTVANNFITNQAALSWNSCISKTLLLLIYAGRQIDLLDEELPTY